MRVLITTFPGKGHFHPVAPLGFALQAAGHDVRVATDPQFGVWVQKCGLTVLPAGRSGEEMEIDAERVPAPERAVELFTTVSVPSLARDLLAHAAEWRPDLVINEEGEHAGVLVAAALGVRAITHSWPAPARPAAEQAARLRALRPIWRRLGVDEEPRLYGTEYLDCCPPSLQTEAVDGIEGVVQARPTMFDGPADDSLGWLADLEGPVVFVTLGTVPRFCRPETLQLIAESAAELAGTVVVATGPHPRQAVAEHSNIRTVRYVPLSRVMPLTDLAVSHGGASTVLACLLAGVPHLVLPQGAPSQERAAASVAAVGLGAVLRPPFDGPSISAAVAALLDDDDASSRIQAIARSVQALPGPTEIAEWLSASH